MCLQVSGEISVDKSYSIPCSSDWRSEMTKRCGSYTIKIKYQPSPIPLNSITTAIGVAHVLPNEVHPPLCANCNLLSLHIVGLVPGLYSPVSIKLIRSSKLASSIRTSTADLAKWSFKSPLLRWQPPNEVAPCFIFQHP
jgi:hypothetical protein